MHIHRQRAHENASLLARQNPCFKSNDYSFCLNICTYIENHQHEMLKMGQALHIYRHFKVFVSSNEKIYLLIEYEGFKLGSGTVKTVYKGLNYFKGKLIAFCVFNQDQIKMKEKFSDQELSEKYEDTSKNLENEFCVIDFLNKNVPKGIIKLLHAFKSENEILGIFKYYRCGELRCLSRSEIPSRPQKIKMAYELISALNAIHQQGLAHNDIKEDNILVDVKRLKSKRNQIEVAFADFNLFTEKFANDDGNFNSFQYVTGGTPIYYSPEKIERMISEKYKSSLSFEQAKKSDVWALGCVLYNLFIGTPPWFKELQSIANTFYSEKYRSAITLKDFINRNFPEPEKKDSIEHLIWSMLRPNYEERISAEDAIPRVKELLPKPIIPLLKLLLGYPSSDSLETADSEDASENSRDSLKNTPNETPKEFTPKTSRIVIQRSNSFPNLKSAKV